MLFHKNKRINSTYYKNKKLKLIYKGDGIKDYDVNTSVKLNINEFDVLVGTEFKLKDTNNVFFREQTWSTSDSSKATVEDGIVKILQKGDVTITCTNKYGNYDRCTFHVYEKDSTKIPYYWNENDVRPEFCLYRLDANRVIVEPEGHETTFNCDTSNQDYLRFDGSSSLGINMKQYYGWDSNAYKSDFIYVFDVEFEQFTNVSLYDPFSVTTEGKVHFRYDSESGDLFTLQLNKRYRIACIRRHGYYYTYDGFTKRIVIADESGVLYDSGFDTVPAGGGHWIDNPGLVNTNSKFVGKLYSIQLIDTHYNNISKPTDEDYAWIDDNIINGYIFGDGCPIKAPQLKKVTRNVLVDLAENDGECKLRFIIDPPNDKVKVIDKDKVNYDLVEYDYEGYITNIYKNDLRAAYYEKSVEIDRKQPCRYNMYYGLYDNISKKLQRAPLTSIRITDSRIDKTVHDPETEEDEICKQMYISPAGLVGRPGDIKLLRATFVPEQVKNIKVKYISSDESVATVGEYDGIVEMKAKGRCEIIAVSQSNDKIIAKSFVHVERALIDSEKTVIDLDAYGIVEGEAGNNSTVSWNNTVNINRALKEYQQAGYKYAKLPAGHYYVSCEEMDRYEMNTNNGRGMDSITMQTGLDFDITDCIIEQTSNDNPDTCVISFNGTDRCKLINGTIIGDLYTHNYGMRINEEGNMLENGSYHCSTGEPILPEEGQKYSQLDPTHNAEKYVRTKDFIEFFESEWDERRPILPSFSIMPLWNTSMNTVDGGQHYCYFYDENDNFISASRGGFLAYRTIPEGAVKFKISFRSEHRLDAIYLYTWRDGGRHHSFEFGTGVKFVNSFDTEINGTHVMNCQGDVCGTHPASLGYDRLEDGTYGDQETYAEDIRWINCDLEQARRQGISFVATGENYLILDTKIHDINGVDPQCGVDFEAYGRNEKYLFKRTEFYSNRKWDMVDCFSGDIEVDSCKFDGAIGLGQSSYNWYVHDSRFMYDDEKYANTDSLYWKQYKIHNTTGIVLPITVTNKYTYGITENNYIDGGAIAKRTTLTGSSRASNNYHKNDTIVNGNDVTIYSNSYNLNIQTNYLRISSEIYNLNTIPPGNALGIIFEGKNVCIDNSANSDIILDAGNNAVNISAARNTIGEVNNAKIHNFQFNGKSIGLALLNNCTINNDDNKSLGAAFSNAINLKNCTLNIPRLKCPYSYTGAAAASGFEEKYVLFEDCNINIRDVEATNDAENVELFSYGYGEEKCPIIFRRCTINSNKKVTINTKQIEDCTFEGGAVPKQYNMITDFTVPNSINTSVNEAYDISVSFQNSNESKRIFWSLPDEFDLMEVVYVNNNTYRIQTTKPGTYTIYAYTCDGSKIRKPVTVNVV